MRKERSPQCAMSRLLQRDFNLIALRLSLGLLAGGEISFARQIKTRFSLPFPSLAAQE